MKPFQWLRTLLDPRTKLARLRGGTAPSYEEGDLPAGMHSRLHARAILSNGPLIVGAMIVLGLFLIVLFGPLWAPMNPYIAGEHIAPHYDFERDVFVRPPLEPSAEYPLGTDQWGSDLLSMLLYGARNTLIACAFITMMRVILGVALGGVAGWNEGDTIDQLVMGMIGVLNAVPMLISSILLIFALDIRRGLPVFLLALSAIGWTEIAQYIRSEFIVLRNRPYIEGARSIGLTGIATAIRHVLPNVIPQLIVITFLEMGAVMMLLGELGFLGVYIGGGSRISIETDAMQFQIFTLADVPEWGAMLAEGFRYLRSKPFVVAPPAMAFFVSVFGFNTLGEGLRQLFERYSINTAFLLKKRMLMVVAGMVAATAFIINRTGPAPWFDRVARAFDAGAAYEHVAALTAMDGRGIGQAGGALAAAYITEHFEAYGLDPGWRHGSYEYPLEAVVARPLEQPRLTLMNTDGAVIADFRHQADFGYLIEGHGGSGDVEGFLTYLGFTEDGEGLTPQQLSTLDLTGRIAVLREGEAPEQFATEALLRGAVGVIWLMEGIEYGSLSQLAVLDEETAILQRPSLPVFRVQGEFARALEESAGLSEQESCPADVTLMGEGWCAVEVDLRARMALQLMEPSSQSIPVVMGYLKGSDFDLADELVVLFAAYDGLGIDPDGTVYPGANHNASGIAMMLEIARLWQEQNLDTRRAALFVAYGAGSLPMDAARVFLEDEHHFRHLVTDNMSQSVRPVMLFNLDNVGAGNDVVEVSPSSSPVLMRLLEEAASEQEVAVIQSESLDNFSPSIRGQVPYLQFQWAAPWIDPAGDVLALVDSDKLQQLGEAFSLALTQIFRQADY